MWPGSYGIIEIDVRLAVLGIVALLAALALAVGFRLKAGKNIEQRRKSSSHWLSSGIWIATFLIATTLCVVLIVPAVRLAGLVWHGASSDLAGPAGSSNVTDAVANTMTAVGVAITVVTLILTVGTSWFATQQRDLQRKLLQVDLELARSNQRDEIDRLRMQVAVLSYDAKRAAMHWLQDMGTGPDLLPIWYFDISADLDQLSVDNLDARRHAFMRLVQMFDAEVWNANLATIATYTDECHRFALAMLHFKRRDQSILCDADAERKGLACRIFDRTEIARIMGIST